jgi:hypothetical protein
MQFLRGFELASLLACIYVFYEITNPIGNRIGVCFDNKSTIF